MSTKKEIKVSLVNEKEYLFSARRSGSATLISNAGSRLYANPTVNGTSAIFLAVLGVLPRVREGKEKIVGAETLREGLVKTRAANFETDTWRRVAATYNSLGRSKNIRSKIGAVYNDIRAQIENGYLRGVDISSIATEEYRKSVGFNF